MLKYIKAFAIGCFIIPVLTVTVSYLISIHLDLVPKCIPFFEGCTSISRTGRYEPVKYYFKFFMFVYVLFLFVLDSILSIDYSAYLIYIMCIYI